jgi:tetratricopeptide (TPR) repeat protein
MRINFRWACYRWLHSQGRFEEALACSEEQARIAGDAGLLFVEQQCLGDTIADSELALGRLAAAEAHCRSSLHALQRMNASQRSVAHVLDTLARVLAVQGQHEEAIATGQRALQLTKNEGFHFRMLEPMALSAAGQGRLRDAAWVTGHVDASYAQRGEVRWPSVAAQRARLDALLDDGLDSATIAALRSEGARGDEPLAFAKAFGTAEAEVGVPVGAA